MNLNVDLKRWRRLLAVVAVVLATTHCTIGTPRSARRGGDASQAASEMRGIASWYGPDFHGRPTASGEIYDMHAPTAAHRSLPLGTWVEVRNLRNTLTTRVRINDRGPFVRGRVIDLSRAAAAAIDMLGTGTDPVQLTVVRLGPSEKDTPGARFTVQVGAFANAANAERLRDRLRARFDDVAVEEAGGIHRVKVGDLPGRNDAEELQVKLERGGYPGFVSTR